jgi:alcohol dehydrogenase class IV
MNPPQKVPIRRAIVDPSRVYQYAAPGKIIFGPKALNELRTEIDLKKIPLVTTDEGIIRSGILKRVTDLLEEVGVQYYIFDQVESDPSLGVVEKASASYRRYGCTLVIGLGGGSSIDVAKAVGLSNSQEGSLVEYAGARPIKGRLPPIYAIPTTAGTGSEVTAVSIISDHENKLKIPIRNPQLMPKVVILDPLLLSSIPSKVAAETSADALSHAIESYVGLGSYVLTDTLALTAIRMISENAVKFMLNPMNVEVAGQMLLASCMAGLSFNNAGLGLVHSIVHPIGAYFHVPHGLACALYLPTVMKFNASACPEKFASIADAMGRNVSGLQREDAAEQAVVSTRDLIERMGLPSKLSQLGIQFRLDPKMVDAVIAAVPTGNNPRKADRIQIAKLFETAA